MANLYYKQGEDWTEVPLQNNPYGIGAYYQSEQKISPSTIVGGTWEYLGYLDWGEKPVEFKVRYSFHFGTTPPDKFFYRHDGHVTSYIAGYTKKQICKTTAQQFLVCLLQSYNLATVKAT